MFNKFNKIKIIQLNRETCFHYTNYKLNYKLELAVEDQKVKWAGYDC